MIKIALDAMGSDNSPSMDVEGAIMAAREFDYEIILVGKREAIEKELEKHKAVPKNIFIEHAPEVIGMHEQPVLSVRRKKCSSIVVQAAPGHRKGRYRGADAYFKGHYADDRRWRKYRRETEAYPSICDNGKRIFGIYT